MSAAGGADDRSGGALETEAQKVTQRDLLGFSGVIIGSAGLLIISLGTDLLSTVEIAAIGTVLVVLGALVLAYDLGIEIRETLG